MWIRKIFLLLLLLFLTSVQLQKLSEEEPVEGSANAISPDDEDFEEGSGLPPEEPVEHKPTSVKPNFATEDHKIVVATTTTTLRSRAPIRTIPITPRPDEASLGGFSTTMIILGIVAILVIIALVVLIICCWNSEYTQGRRKDVRDV